MKSGIKSTGKIKYPKAPIIKAFVSSGVETLS
jgi:hypothetical protein